jgi:UvrD-like helicase family protein/nuclease-like protein
MSAGTSAAQQSQRLSALAQSHLREAERAAASSGRFAAAAIAERRLATRLSPLTAHGYYLLADRKWPDSKNAQLDLIVVGPSGVWIVDSKWWKDFSVAAGSMFRDQADVTNEVLRLADVANAAEAAFADVGLAPGEVRPLLVMANHQGRLGEVGTVEVVGEVDVHKHLAARGRRLTPSQVERVLAVAMEYFPPYNGPQSEETDSPAVILDPVLPELPDALLEDGALLSEQEVTEALSEAELAAPIEDWMTFLNPAQASLVRRTFNGPARIRGAAGTGKTVVGLHRAAYLARVHPQGRILFTTFVRTLPAVMANLLKRMAPEVAERVDFVHVHGFATNLLRSRGVSFRLNSREATQLLDQAWNELPLDLRARLARQRPFSYWREEVESVVKGRGFVTFDQYADCARPGRELRLNVDDRRAVWALCQGYDQLLRHAGLCDFQDLVLLAESSLREQPLTGYSAVIVDEAQDLSLAMIRLLFSLVGDGTDAFTLIGDGQQSIYPGGYVLSEAGISLAGRGVVMDHNYRNTVEIQEYASSLIADSDYVDIDDFSPREIHPHDRGVVTGTRHGTAPELPLFDSRAAHDSGLVTRISSAVESGELSPGDIAILCDTNGEATYYEKLLEKSNLATINLLEYAGLPTECVKVGTIKRAKGLEFKMVMLPWSSLTHSNGDSEADARTVRERYVAATRARDILWIGSR